MRKSYFPHETLSLDFDELSWLSLGLENKSELSEQIHSGFDEVVALDDTTAAAWAVPLLLRPVLLILTFDIAVLYRYDMSCLSSYICALNFMSIHAIALERLWW